MTRLKALLETSDFADIRTPFALAGPPYQGYTTNHFDNVRFVVDPQAICIPGVTAEVASPPSSGDGSTEWQNLVALAYDIVDAEDAGLAVILDCHPHVFSARHYEYLCLGHVNDFPQVPQAPAGAYWNFQSAPSYQGPYKFDMVTNLTGVPPTLDHPLLKFWYSLPRNLDAAYGIAKLDRHPESSGDSLHLNPAKVFFEIMNEPFQDMQWFYQPGITSGKGPGQWASDAQLFRFPEWRDLQKSALNVVSQWDSRFWCIATTYLSDPRDLSGWTGGQYPPTPYGNVYSQSELPSNYDKVAYCVHFYEPFRFTHNKFFAPDTSAGYTYKRDFLGILTDPNDPEENPFFRDVPENDTQFAICNSAQPMLARITTWRASLDNRINNAAPPMIVTEFGAMKQGLTPGLNPAPEDPVDSNPNENVGNYRYQWTFDVRGNIEASGIGWNCFAYTGNFATWTGNTLWSASNFNARGTHGTIKTYMKDALFGLYYGQLGH